MEWAVKLIGTIAIVAAGVLIGNRRVAALKGRAEILSEMIQLLTDVKNNFLYRQSDLIFALNNIAARQYNRLDINLSSISSIAYKEEVGVRINGSKNIPLLLNAEQQEKFKECLTLIGLGTLSEECDRLDYYINYFKHEQEAAILYEQNNRKLYYAMSVYVSIIVAVILI